MKNRFWGSTTAIILGISSCVGGISSIASGAEGHGSLTAGAVMVLGGAAYRSLKKRRLGLKPDNIWRHLLEGSLLLALILIVILQKNLLYLIENDPAPNFVTPLWALIAYAVIVLKKRQPSPPPPLIVRPS